MEKLQEDYGRGIIDQNTYQKLKRNLDRFTIADINLDDTIIGPATLVTNRPQAIQNNVDKIKKKLTLQKLKDELEIGRAHV